MTTIRPVIVTGAAGFIGSHLCERLLAAGHRVVGVDNFCTSYDPALKRANLTQVSRHPDFLLVEADILDAEAMDAVFASHRPDRLFHFAAAPGVRPSMERPSFYAAVNVTGTANVLQAATTHGIERIVFASSSSVYANNRTTPFSEDQRVDFPISPYAATKRAGELLCHTFHHLTQIPIAVLRIFTAYGPRQRPDLCIATFLDRIAHGLPLPVYGDGTTSRDYTYIGDLVAGITAAADRCDTYRIYNLGSDQPVVLRDVVTTIEKVTGRTAHVETRPRQPGDVDHTWADISRARRELGYDPATSLEEGIAAQWEWMQGRR